MIWRMDIPELLRTYRRNRLETLTSVSRQSGVSLVTLSRIERRETNPSLLTVGRLMRLPGFADLMETTKED